MKERRINPTQQIARLFSLYNDIDKLSTDVYIFFEEMGEEALLQEISTVTRSHFQGREDLRAHTFLGQAFGLFKLLGNATEIEDMERIRAEVAFVREELLQRKEAQQNL